MIFLENMVPFDRSECKSQIFNLIRKNPQTNLNFFIFTEEQQQRPEVRHLLFMKTYLMLRMHVIICHVSMFVIAI